MVDGISGWSLANLLHGDGVLGGLGGWWDFWLVVGEFDARCRIFYGLLPGGHANKNKAYQNAYPYIVHQAIYNSNAASKPM